MLHQALCIISKPSVNPNWSYSLERLHLGKKWHVFVPCDPEIWRMTMKNYRAPLLCYFTFCASFQSDRWIPTAVTVWKHSIRVKIFCRVWPCNLTDDLPCYFKLCPSFNSRLLIKLELRSRNAQIGAKFVLDSVTFNFDLWPWPFAWKSLLPMVITSQNLMMIQWQEHWKRFNKQSDGWTEPFLELPGCS